MIAKIHTGKDGRTLLAVCDKELIGNVFSEGKKRLDLTGEFYKGEPKTKKEVSDLIRNADMLNLVGKEAIEAGKAEEVLDEGDVKTISGIPLFQSLSSHHE